LPLRAVIVLERGESFALERSHDAVSLLEGVVTESPDAEELRRQLGACMTMTRVAALLEARIPAGMSSRETAGRLLAAL
jgi:hypothetical protein